MSLRVAAIIVTYNRAALLDQSIGAVKKQSRKPEKLFIVNNNSSDGTEDIIRAHQLGSEFDIELIALSENLGGAGGFNRGLKVSYLQNFDAFWLMDDDTVPDVDALHYLIDDLSQFEAKTGHRPGYICSTVLWKDGSWCEMNIPSATWDWARYLGMAPSVALVESCSFVSILIPREKVKTAGLPISEYFIWYDDVEYTKRLSKAGFPGLLSLRSRVQHLIDKNEGVRYSSVTEKNLWKFKYGMRNESAYILRNDGLLKYTLHTLKQGRNLLRLPVSFRIKVSLLRACLSALWFSYKVEKPH